LTDQNRLTGKGLSCRRSLDREIPSRAKAGLARRAIAEHLADLPS